MKIRKRDKNLQEFDKNKIKVAITKANNDTDEYHKIWEGDIDLMVDVIVEEIKADYGILDESEDVVVDIEKVQDDVLLCLARAGYYKLSENYAVYRAEHKRLRDKRDAITKKMLSVINCDNVQNSNANVDEYSFGGRKFESAGVALKDLALEEYISEDVAEAHKQNRIYIHDLDSYSIGMHNCLFIDFKKLLTDGFTTRNGDVRPPRSISTAMQQVAVIFQCQSQVQFGGVASAHIDFDLAPFVAMSFKKHYIDGLKYVGGWYSIPNDVKEVESYLGFEFSIGNTDCQKYDTDVYNYALDMTERECMQAAQGLYHNLNTLESRAGSQLPFTSINFGRDTSPEGRMVTKSLLEASIDGIGKFHRTSIFPISIFQHKKGVNAAPSDPNYDLKQLAIKSLTKRIYPNWVNCDFTENHEDFDNPDTYNCTMGCRTAMSYDRHGMGYSKVGRGNVSPVTVNLPKIGIKHGICLGERSEPDIKGFWKELDEVLALTERALLERYAHICSQDVKSAPFMYKNETVRGFDGETIQSVMKHGSQAVGFIGMAETCQALFGKNQLDPEVHEFAMQVVQHIKKFCEEASERNNLNFGEYYTPAEGCCYTICQKLKDEFGEIPNITDKEFLTNSIHVPVWEEVDIFTKIDCEAPLTQYGTSGCITYTEFDAKVIHNPEAVEAIINYAMDKNVPYFAINFPIDTCLDCGYAGEIPDECPVCGSDNIERLARVTGYLTTDVSNFNKGKQDEVARRYKHSKKTFNDC